MSAEVFDFSNSFLQVSQVLVILRALRKAGGWVLYHGPNPLHPFPQRPNFIISYTYKPVYPRMFRAPFATRWRVLPVSSMICKYKS